MNTLAEWVALPSASALVVIAVLLAKRHFERIKNQSDLLETLSLIRMVESSPEKAEYAGVLRLLEKRRLSLGKNPNRARVKLWALIVLVLVLVLFSPLALPIIDFLFGGA